MASTELREQITDKFGDVVASDEKLLVECISMCQIYNITPEDLFYKWEASKFNTRSLRSDVEPIFSMDVANALKKELQQKLASENAKIQKANRAWAKDSAASTNRNPRFGGFKRNLVPQTGPGTPVKVERGADKSLFKTEQELPNIAGPSKVTFKGPKTDEPSRKQRAYRYGYEKISERSEGTVILQLRLPTCGSLFEETTALDDRIDECAEVIREHYKISELGDPGSSADDEITVVGRITLDAESSSATAKLNEASLTLESSRMMGAGVRVPLRFDSEVKIRGGAAGAGGIGLFPGAIVALRGKNGAGERFHVNEILAMPPRKPSAVSPEGASGSFSMCVASGPYTLDADLKFKPWHTLVQHLKFAQPAVVLLIGPFVDAAHPLVKNGDLDETPTELFRRQFSDNIRDFLDLSPGSTVLIVPSIRDIVSDHAVYPQCELGSELFGDSRVQLLPNPCRFSINDVFFAVDSVDVLFHLRKEELFKRCGEVDSVVASSPDDTGSDALANLCRHLLQQRSFYPLFPPPLDVAHEVNLDITHSGGLKLVDEAEGECAPDVLIVPSRLKQFSKAVYTTTALNPSFLTKGTYATIHFAGHGAGSVSSRIKVDLPKLDG